MSDRTSSVRDSYALFVLRHICLSNSLATYNSQLTTLTRLIVENTDYIKTYKLDYHGGEQYPHLVRDTSKPDLLSEIIKAK